jgi:phenylpropionate dioxygenase-like ring-hydroxylating dioxygenase large terminal subunit
MCCPLPPQHYKVDAPPPAPPTDAPANADRGPTPAEAAAEADAGPYNWYGQWYPAAAVGYLRPGRPEPLQLLNMRLVAFQGADGEWAVLEDACPHRLAPLSDGRLTAKGEVMCSYHGWTFDSKGACTSIPQLGDEKAHATACSSARSCVKRFPCQVRHGLLWVYADSSPEAWATAFAAPPAAGLDGCGIGEGPEFQREIKQYWFVRDTPVGLDFVGENLLDPVRRKGALVVVL